MRDDVDFQLAAKKLVEEARKYENIKYESRLQNDSSQNDVCKIDDMTAIVIPLLDSSFNQY